MKRHLCACGFMLPKFPFPVWFARRVMRKHYKTAHTNPITKAHVHND